MADVCTACGCIRARPGDAQRNLRLVLFAVALAPYGDEVAAVNALPTEMGRCWFGDDASCSAWHAKEREEVGRGR